MKILFLLALLLPVHMFSQKSVNFHMHTVPDVVKTDTIVIQSVRQDSMIYMRFAGADKDIITKFYWCSFSPIVKQWDGKTLWIYLLPNQDIRSIGITYKHRHSKRIECVTLQYNDMKDHSKLCCISRMQVLDGNIKLNRK